MVYDLPLVEEKVKAHHITTLHLVCALAFIGTGAIVAIYNYTLPVWWGLGLLVTGLLILGLTIIKNKWVISKKINLILRIKELLISVLVGVYSFEQHWKFPSLIFGVLSAALLFAFYWERNSGGLLYVHIDDNGLKLPVVRRRFIPWSEVEQVVLRFGTLTINCIDNHFFQWNILDPDFDNEIFEQFCNVKVEENISKRRNDDW
jgi:hypothetical protein